LIASGDKQAGAAAEQIKPLLFIGLIGLANI
jgi:hypothetical protein